LPTLRWAATTADCTCERIVYIASGDIGMKKNGRDLPVGDRRGQLAGAAGPMHSLNAVHVASSRTNLHSDHTASPLPPRGGLLRRPAGSCLTTRTIGHAQHGRRRARIVQVDLNLCRVSDSRDVCLCSCGNSRASTAPEIRSGEPVSVSGWDDLIGVLGSRTGESISLTIV